MPLKRSRLNDYLPRKTARKIDLTDNNMEFAVLEAREASFAPPSKRSKAGWPHKTPTPTDLARAGFFYKPVSSKDNVECFMCGRHLDGWEEDDDALQEHMKHGPDCAWATIASLEQETTFDTENMEDPTGEHLKEARRTTFETIGWPHEGKRGWVCKVDRMVEAGWHFAPTTECEDYVSCVYCKLSLDGWEPKDDPFDEHYRRSPNCPFFVFAGTTAASKRPKQKRGRASKSSRTSKASRLSTQSNETLLSQAESAVELDPSLDTSTLSIQSTTSTATTKSKRKAPTRAKSTKSKRAKTTKSKLQDPETQEEPELDMGEEYTRRSRTQKEESQNVSTDDPKYPSLGRASDAYTVDRDREHIRLDNNATPQPEVDQVGPPERESSPIPVKQPSPLKEQTKPPRAIVSSTPTTGNTDPDVATPSKQDKRSPSQPSDIENAPPSSRPKSERPPLSSSGEPVPTWTPIDIESVLKVDEVVNLFPNAQSGQLSDEEETMTVQEWIEYLASQAEQNLSQEAERIVGIFEEEGQRAMKVLEGLVCV